MFFKRQFFVEAVDTDQSIFVTVSHAGELNVGGRRKVFVVVDGFVIDRTRVTSASYAELTSASSFTKIHL